jgi:hypothetical protein
MKLLKTATLGLILSLGLIAFGCQEKKQAPAPEKKEAIPSDLKKAVEEKKAEAAIQELNDQTPSNVKEGVSEMLSFFDDASKAVKEATDETKDMNMPKDSDEMKEKAKKVNPEEETEETLPEEESLDEYPTPETK